VEREEWDEFRQSDLFGFLRRSAMELMQLEMFVAMVEEGSVHGAARRVCRTAPAVSMAVGKLEREVAVPLFNRSRRHAYRLTPAGEVVLGYAKKMLSLRDEVTSTLKGLKDLESGCLRIGAIESININLLPHLAQAFHQKYPSVKIEVSCRHSDELLRELRGWDLDLALLARLPEENGWEAQLMMRDEIALIVSPNHALAERKEIRLENLSTETIIIEGSSSSLYGELTKAFNRSRTPLRIHIESAAIETIKKMVTMNVGVGFVPYLCVREELDRRELVRVKVKGLLLERTLWAVRRASAAESPALKAFMQTVCKYAEKWQRGQGRLTTCERKSSSKTRSLAVENESNRSGKPTLLPFQAIRRASA
jgi:DNA-binding transcriptional LysR family regulator